MIMDAFIVINVFRLMEMRTSALRPFEYHLPHINLTLPILLERLIVNIDLLSPYFVDLWGCEQESPSMEKHAVRSSFSLCAEQLELPLQTSPLNPVSPSSTTLSLCVSLCMCVWRKTWQWKELKPNSGSLGEWLQSRLISVQVIAHAYGRVISGCLEPAGGQGSSLALTNTAKRNNHMKWITALRERRFWNTFQLKSA